MYWLNEAPPTDEANFFSTLSMVDESTACKIASSFMHKHAISSVYISSTALHNRGLQTVVQLVPEIHRSFQALTHRQARTIVLVEDGIHCQTPYRPGNLRVKGLGMSTKLPSHIVYTNGVEAEKFVKFGTATLVIVVQRGGVLGTKNKVITGLAHAVQKRRVESVLVISDEKTTQSEWLRAYFEVGYYGITIGYTDI